MMYRIFINARAARRGCFAFVAWAGLAGAFFASIAQAQTSPADKTSSTGAAAAALPEWVHQKRPPRGVPLRLGVLPPEAFKPHTIPGWGPSLICNLIWQDQAGSPERPFAVMYATQNMFSKTIFYPGMVALDDLIVHSHNDFGRYETAGGYGKGDRRVLAPLQFFNPAEEAALLIEKNQETGMENTYWAIYFKKLKSGKCGNEKLSECKRFEAQAELYEFMYLPGSDFLRKADIGKVHIESRCVGQQYLYHKEPFLERPGLAERLLRGLRND